MPNDVVAAQTIPSTQSPGHPAVASIWHTLPILALLAFQTIRGILPSPGPSQPPAAVPLYLTGSIIEWLLLGYVWWGLRLRGHSLRTMIGGKWSSAKDLVRDVLLAFLFWGLWYAVLTLLKFGLAAFGIHNVHSGFVYPQGLSQILIFIATSVTAGIVEESVFRGYLLKQFSAWTGSTTLSVVLQAIVFGVSHSYFGLRQVIVISASGTLIGIFALWRRTLRPAMMFHAWANIFGAVITKGLPFQ